MDLKMTSRQQEIFQFIKRYAAKYGYPPTVREIGKAVGLASSSTVHAHLANLEKYGVLRRDPTKPRAIELLFDKAKKVVGTADGPCRSSAGSRPARRCSRRRTSRTTSRCPRWPAATRASTCSRCPVRACATPASWPGDYVVVHRQESARDGDIVVALVGEEATVKRFFRESDHVRLQPENPSMEPIRSREVEVLGRVVGVFRKV